MPRNTAAFNLRFITGGANMVDGLVKYLQGIFGQCAGVVRKMGNATVASGNTSVDVADTGISATDFVDIMPKVQGATPGTFPTAVTITAGVKFNVAVNQNPGAGGFQFGFCVVTPVP